MGKILIWCGAYVAMCITMYIIDRIENKVRQKATRKRKYERIITELKQRKCA